MADQSNGGSQRADLLRMTAEVAAAYLSNNSVATNEVPNVISSVYRTLTDLNSDGSRPARASNQKAAVPVKRSVTPEFLICLEDGKKLKMLKRHLRTNYDMTPEEYRVKWGLPPDYPMVAPNYAAQRSAFAKKIGLGRNPPGSPSRQASTRQ